MVIKKKNTGYTSENIKDMFSAVKVPENSSGSSEVSYIDIDCGTMDLSGSDEALQFNATQTLTQEQFDKLKSGESKLRAFKTLISDSYSMYYYFILEKINLSVGTIGEFTTSSLNFVCRTSYEDFDDFVAYTDITASVYSEDLTLTIESISVKIQKYDSSASGGSSGGSSSTGEVVSITLDGTEEYDENNKVAKITFSENCLNEFKLLCGKIINNNYKTVNIKINRVIDGVNTHESYHSYQQVSTMNVGTTQYVSLAFSFDYTTIMDNYSGDEIISYTTEQVIYNIITIIINMDGVQTIEGGIKVLNDGTIDTNNPLVGSIFEFYLS